ncbi:FAD:protein FMN transferase [Diaminobutyricibacter tongyongensis]|uniref:FAD:protein FMN transferase n=1 Tax=Leifsonia tongyongensis TaxID=1268043 RepID=A0A6L9XYI6_9MICO|nr:FAD:protein FMN transferase [Diaminobutyricibacter tongyongensis]NEN06038.1 FAD:protein FMN transferase [Diaminobutyricibacter tongyongensis]
MCAATADWNLWSTSAHLVVTKPSVLARAERMTRELTEAVDLACSRFRDDSELSILQSAPRFGAPAPVSPVLADLIRAALWAAALTDGAVDPTLGNDLLALGYDRDIARLDPPADGDLPVDITVGLERRSPGRRRVLLDGDRLTVPDDLRLDLGATAKAVAADRIAERIADELGCGVLISLGGDIATAGPAIDAHWEILVQDTQADPAQQVALPSGLAMATSSTRKRRWSQSGLPRHHILDPRFGLPVEPVWRSATVAAASCLRANALSTAAIVRGTDAPAWLASAGADARLVDRDGRVVTTGNWPAEEAQHSAAQHAAAVGHE